MKVHDVPSEGPPLSSEQDALDLLAAAYEGEADLVAIPVARLAPEVWQLSNGRLGAFVQKFVNYSFRLAIVGDISMHTAKSKALTDFVRESNRRRGELRFVPSREGLEG